MANGNPYGLIDWDMVPSDTGTSIGAASTDSGASVSVPWYSGLSSIIASVGKAAQGIMTTRQGAVYDQYGRLVSINGQPVYNYNPTGTLGGLVGGMSITSLLLLGLGILLVVKLAK